MKLQRQTWGLLVVAVLVSGAVGLVFYQEQNQGQMVEGKGDKALPALIGKVDLIDRLVLTGPEGGTTLLFRENHWVVANVNNYSADQTLVMEFLGGLGMAEKFDPRTSEARFFGRLGFEDRLVEIKAFADNQELAALKTGDQFFSPTGEGVMTFAFDPVTNRAWTMTNLPEISLEPSFWLARELLGLSEFRIKRLEVSIAENPVWAIIKETPMSANFSLEGTDAAQAIIEAVNAAGLGATDLYLDDVFDPTGFELLKVAEAKYQTFDGLTVTMVFYDQNGLILTTLEAAFDENVLLADDTPSVLLDAPVDGLAEANALNQRWQGRYFQIPLQKLAAILKFRQEFFRGQNPSN